MCNFLSAIIMKNGDLLCRPDLTDSHEDLLQFHNVRDGLAQQGHFVRLEFTPPEDTSTISDLSTWKLVVDEEKTPDWFDPEAAREKLAARVSRMLVDDSRDLLLGGCWILVGEAKVKNVKNARIFGMYGSSRVGAMRDSSRVEYMYGSSRVEYMYGSSRVEAMYGASRVGAMYGVSRVGYMYSTSRVEEMYGTSQVGYMYDTSQVGTMRGSSQVGVMYDSSQVGTMYESSGIPEEKTPDSDYR